MPTARARAASLLPFLLLVALVLTVLTALPAAPSRAADSASLAKSASASTPAAVTAAASSATPDAAHPYTDPVWFPLRNPSHVGCVVNNCPGPYHGYWAIDFGGNVDDPIYAAGGGVFHIGDINNTCPTSGNTSGTWVWIDHGPAGVTIYEHLNRVLAQEGQLVTPATEIGTMGHNGNTYPCHPNYLHMEWRAQRLGGTRMPIPAMSACLSGGAQTFPSALGYGSWNSMPNNKVATPSLTNNCMPASWNTPNRPTINVNRASRAAVVIPSARPGGTDAWKDRIEEYHPSLHAYGLPVYHNHYATTDYTTIGGLTDGHTYRISAAFHNNTGWSAWAPTVIVIPASPPTVPSYRGMSHGTNWATYSWYRSTSAGSSTATYQVARRCYFSGAWHSWVYSTVPGYDISYTWHPIAPRMTCEVTVRAHNSVGWSGFSQRKFVTTS
jgi:murein DD-endopeptidase MepM/ murein hydrolase activator NlpD